MKKPTTKIIFIIFLAALFGSYLFYNAFASLSLQNKPKSLTDGLVGYWTFDGQDMINNVADISGNGNTGYLKGTFATATSSATILGKTGQALDFNGTDDYVDVSDDPSLEIGTSNFSISFWFKRKGSFGESQGLLDHLASGAGYQVLFNTSNNLRLRVDDSVDYVLMDSDTVFTDNEWYNVVFVADKSFATGGKIYINGIQEATTYNLTAIDDITETGTQNLWIGMFQSTLNFNGSLDDLRIYNRALSASEVTKLYNATKGSKVNSSNKKSLTDGLVGYWTFDGADMINNVADSSGNGNTGYLNGAFATATSTVIGKVGQTLDFNGSDDYVNLGQSSSLMNVFKNDTDSTICAWVKSDRIISSGKETYNIMAYKFIAGTSAIIGLQGDWGVESIIFYGINAWSSDRVQTDDLNLTADTWYNVCVANTIISTASSTASIYLDGVIKKTDFLDRDTFPDPADNSDIYITYDTDDSSINDVYFPGLIDDVRIYNRTLSASEITRLYNLTKGDKINTSNKKNLTDGLVGYWTFDGADMINNVADSSGNGNTGYLNGTFATATSSATVLGKVGQALDFNGTDDYIQNTSIPKSQLTSDFTVSVWAKASTGITAANALVSSRSSGNDGWSFRAEQYNYTGNVGFTFYGVGDYATSIPTPSGWAMYTAVYDASANTVDIYVNDSHEQLSVGTLVTTNMLDGLMMSSAYRNSTTYVYTNLLDEVRVYNRTLSASEVKRLYNMGR